MQKTLPEPLWTLTHEQGFFCSHEARRAGLHPQTLTRLVRDGILERLARGRYRLAGQRPNPDEQLALAAAAAPRGVICLLSALVFHQAPVTPPPAVWVALPARSWRPYGHRPPLHVVRFGPSRLQAGIEYHRLAGRRVPIYSLAKTISDCFAYRNKIGMDTALAAFCYGRDSGRARLADIEYFSRIHHTERVIHAHLAACWLPAPTS
ncbi:MAG: type IV toxin-antitoxin system AbiEi family antitoxin domain-containing protein [Acidiferrobacter sp.]